jgi:uncharacterized membrane protein
VKLLRTISWFTRLLVGLFLVAQFAGVVSAPRANALPMMAAAAQTGVSHMDGVEVHHHAQGHNDQGGLHDHHDRSGNPADTCCALHACFAGVLPPVIAIAAETVVGEPLCVRPDDLAPGAPGGRLDRPPRPLH